MRWLLFLARVAFICNVCFVLCVVFRYLPVRVPQFISGAVITLGYVAIIVNTVMQVLHLIFRAYKIPRWLMILNLVLFVAEIIYFFG